MNARNILVVAMVAIALAGCYDADEASKAASIARQSAMDQAHQQEVEEQLLEQQVAVAALQRDLERQKRETEAARREQLARESPPELTGATAAAPARPVVREEIVNVNFEAPAYAPDYIPVYYYYPEPRERYYSTVVFENAYVWDFYRPAWWYRDFWPWDYVSAYNYCSYGYGYWTYPCAWPTFDEGPTCGGNNYFYGNAPPVYVQAGGQTVGPGDIPNNSAPPPAGVGSHAEPPGTRHAVAEAPSQPVGRVVRMEWVGSNPDAPKFVSTRNSANGKVAQQAGAGLRQPPPVAAKGAAGNAPNRLSPAEDRWFHDTPARPNPPTSVAPATYVQHAHGNPNHPAGEAAAPKPKKKAPPPTNNP